jgi:septal ring factor EnvC (AmiA/AmiB activator)
MSDENCCGACGYPIHATKESACDWCRQSDDRIEALTEQLEAARADAKEAEAYAEELEKEIELNEQEACMVEDDLIKADKEIDDLKAKLAKLVSIEKRVTSFEDTTEELLECGCARCKAHLDLRAALAEIEGEK